MTQTLKDHIWVIRLFPNDWIRPNHYVLENLFFYDCAKDKSFENSQMGAAIPEKMLNASKEDIDFVHNNWKQLLKNNKPVVFYKDGNWGVDLTDVKNV
jgi:hypothetical protein